MPDKPNVIICLCDQLRAFDVGCYGSDAVRTPNMDRLASEGVRFDIACSNNPVCTPGRSILLSGQHSRTCTGTVRNASEPRMDRYQFPDPVLPEVLKGQGYETALIGKWHIGPAPETLGFDQAVYPHHMHRYTSQTFVRTGGEPIVVDSYAEEFEGQALADYLSARHDSPFFLYYNISQPHMPLDDMPERYKTAYSPQGIPLRENVYLDGVPAYNERWFRIYLWDYLFYKEHLPYTEDLPEGFDLRMLTALYRGAVTWADDQLGRLMRLLAGNGLDDNTLVIFTSDHGDNLGSHGCFNKDKLYEESIRIPMVFRWPTNLAPRIVRSQVASLVDVMPTTLGLLGFDRHCTVQGTDISEVVRGQADVAGENLAFIETALGDIGVRSVDRLYGVSKPREDGSGDRDHMLFDLAGDPLEEHNLAGGAPCDLCERLARWDRETPWMSL